MSGALKYHNQKTVATLKHATTFKKWHQQRLIGTNLPVNSSITWLRCSLPNVMEIGNIMSDFRGVIDEECHNWRAPHNQANGQGPQSV